MNSQSLWQFSKHFDKARKSLLEEVTSFADIVERIVEEVTVTHFNVCHGREGYLKNCFRPCFKFEVKIETFDLFFNSPHGYRAQYLLDPEEGQKQNNRLIKRLSQKLIDFTRGKDAGQLMGADQIMTSLLCCSAKIWISEDNFAFNHDLIEDILVPGWHNHAKAALVAYAKGHYPSPPEQEKAIWGIRAPTGNVLDVKGAFLDAEGKEVVPPSKVHRRFEIKRYGFT